MLGVTTLGHTSLRTTDRRPGHIYAMQRDKNSQGLTYYSVLLEALMYKFTTTVESD